MQITKLENKCKLFKALGESNRLKIIDFLMKENKCTCICELSKLVKKDQSVVFRHVQILKDAGIINTSKDAQFLMCCIKDKELVSKYLGD